MIEHASHQIDSPVMLAIAAGAGLKPEYAEDIFGQPRQVDFFEIHAENYMGHGGPPHDLLRRIRADYPLSIHGVGLSIGGMAALDRDHLARLKRLIAVYQPALFSEHLAWSTHDGVFLNDLLPLPYKRGFAGPCLRPCRRGPGQSWHENAAGESVDIRRLWRDHDDRVQFLSEVAQRTGCGLLLDVNNVHVSAVNHGFDATAYIDTFPMQHVGEFHLAGFAEDCDSEGARLLIDDHGRPVSDVVWDLYCRALARRCLAPTLIEWDNHVPPFATLAGEDARARQLMSAQAGVSPIKRAA